MPGATIGIDQLGADWTEQDINLYNKLDFYLLEVQAKRRKDWGVYDKVVGKQAWKPNQGKTLRGIRKEPSPHLRNFAFPNPIDQVPRKDVPQTYEVKAETEVVHQDFESLMFSFVPDFRDFMRNHVSHAEKDLNEKMLRFNDVYLRSEIFHKAPNIFLPGAADGELQAAPVAAGNITNSAANSKNKLYFQAVIPKVQTGLDLKAVGRLCSYASEEIGIPYFEGEDSPEAMKGKYCLIGSAELYRSWTTDPYALANKTDAMNLVTDRFKGTPFNDLVFRADRFPIRCNVNQDTGAVTFPEPETVELNPAAVNYGQTVPNPNYASIANACTHEIAILCGMDGASAIEIGAPPSAFTKGYEPDNFKKLIFNGSPRITKDFLVPVQDSAGGVRYETNKYGRHLQMIGTVTTGCLVYNPRNFIVVLFKRQRGF